MRQSQRFTAYRAAVEKLQSLGLLYPCFATRGEIAAAIPGECRARDPDGAPLYPGLWRDKPRAEAASRGAMGEPFALRLAMEKALGMAREILAGRPLTFEEWGENEPARHVDARPQVWGDAVIVRKDTPASYHLAVVVDDAGQGVTHVTRGRDLFAATGLHRLLQTLLGLPEPCYAHHRLVLDRNGRKLSKSEGAASLGALRAKGLTPLDIVDAAGLGPP